MCVSRTEAAAPLTLSSVAQTHTLAQVLADPALLNFAPLGVAIGVALVCLRLPSLLGPRTPAALLGVAVFSALAVHLSLPVDFVGTLPTSFSFVTSLPPLPRLDQLPDLAAATLALFGLASLESLLSAASVDSLVDARQTRLGARLTSRHDPNQELIGQGVGNVLAALSGGLVATGVIACVCVALVRVVGRSVRPHRT
jgi:MFS superfamily sulfate permease-like transporter